MKRWMQVVVAAAATLFASQAIAQLSVIQQPGTVHASFTGMGQVGNGLTTPSSLSIYTVPAGKYARLTDLIVSTRTAGLCYFQISSNSTYFSYEITITNGGTLHIPFNNGPAFPPGEQIYIDRSNRIGGQCTDYLFVTVRGYLFTVP